MPLNALESSDGSRYALRHGVGGPGAVAVPSIALQREGALGARLEAHPPRTAVAPAGPPRAARYVDDTPKVRARPRARRTGARRLDAHPRRRRCAAARAAALPRGAGGASTCARARGVLRRGARDWQRGV